MTLLDVETQVDRVFVFRNGAVVTRVGIVELLRRDGPRKARVRLPLTVEPESVRVRLGDAGSWRAVAVAPEPDLRRRSETRNGGVFGPAARFADPDRAEKLRTRLAWLGAQRARFEILSVAPSDAEPHIAGIDATESEIAATQLRDQLLARIDDERASCQQLLDQLAASEQDSMGERAFIVSLEGDDDVKATLELEYFVAGPTWFPSYTLRLSEPNASGTLRTQAFVAQDTGEDWSSVTLRLTTAKYDPPPRAQIGAGRTADGPWRELGAHRLFAGYDMHYTSPRESTTGASTREDSDRRSVPPLVYGDGSTPGEVVAAAIYPADEWLDYPRLSLESAQDLNRGALCLGADDASSERVAAARDRSLRVVRSAPPPRHDRPRARDGYDFALTADLRADVPSTGRPVCCVVEERELEAHTRYIAVPRESLVAYRRVELENESASALLEGPVDVYVDGVYLLTTALEHTSAGETASLYIGTEPRLHVSLDERVEEGSSGILRGAKELRHYVDVHVRNETDTDVTIDVRERIPVSKQDGIRVTIEHVQPPWRRLDPNRPDRPGRYRWRERIEAHGDRTLSMSYVLRVPVRQTIVRTSRGSRP